MRLPRVRWLIPLAIVMLAVLAAGFVPVYLPTGDTTIPESASLRPVGEIASGTTVTEQFPAAASAITSISLLLATYQRVNQGILHVTLSAEVSGQWQEQVGRDLDTATLHDNAYATLNFSPSVPIREGQRVRISLQSDNRPDESVTWLRNPAEQRQGYTLTMNGKALPGSAVFHVSYLPESGRLLLMIGEIWKRSTVFLNVAWQLVLIVSLGGLLASTVALTRRLDDA